MAFDSEQRFIPDELLTQFEEVLSAERKYRQSLALHVFLTVGIVFIITVDVLRAIYGNFELALVLSGTVVFLALSTLPVFGVIRGMVFDILEEVDYKSSYQYIREKIEIFLFAVYAMTKEVIGRIR